MIAGGHHLFNEAELREVLQRDEGQFIEFKSLWHLSAGTRRVVDRRKARDLVVEYVAAFAQRRRWNAAAHHGLEEPQAAIGRGARIGGRLGRKPFVHVLRRQCVEVVITELGQDVAIEIVRASCLRATRDCAPTQSARRALSFRKCSRRRAWRCAGRSTGPYGALPSRRSMRAGLSAVTPRSLACSLGFR